MTNRPPNLPEDDNRYAPPGTRQERQQFPQEPQERQQLAQIPPTNPQERQETPAQRAAWGLAGGLGCLLLIAAMVLIPAVLTAGTFGGGFLLVQNVLSGLTDPGPPSASVISSQTIVQRVQPLGRLVSTEAQVAKADITVNIQQGGLIRCNHSANHVAAATIEAGIDLYAINPDNVTYDEVTDTYTVQVPRPVVTGCSVDFIDQYERERNLPTCSVDWDDARQIAQFEALVEFRDDAVEGGLLVTAERDAQQALSGFVSALTGSNVVIEFVDGPDGNTDPTAACRPQPPRDWTQDAITGQWSRID